MLYYYMHIFSSRPISQIRLSIASFLNHSRLKSRNGMRTRQPTKDRMGAQKYLHKIN